jgi:hypothetical protein
MNSRVLVNKLIILLRFLSKILATSFTSLTCSIKSAAIRKCNLAISSFLRQSNDYQFILSLITLTRLYNHFKCCDKQFGSFLKFFFTFCLLGLQIEQHILDTYVEKQLS